MKQLSILTGFLILLSLISLTVFSQSGTDQEPSTVEEIINSDLTDDSYGLSLTVKGVKSFYVEGVKYRALQQDYNDIQKINSIQANTISLLKLKHSQDSTFISEMVKHMASIKVERDLLQSRVGVLEKKTGFWPTMGKVGIGAVIMLGVGAYIHSKQHE